MSKKFALCYLCAILVRQAWPDKELQKTNQFHNKCGHCHKKRHAKEYELVDRMPINKEDSTV